MINITNYNVTSLNTIDSCRLSSNAFSGECIIKNICNPIHSWLINTGITIIISYIIITWFLWWFLNYGYKIFKVEKLYNLENRVLWDMWVRQRLTNVMIMYITIIIYFNW